LVLGRVRQHCSAGPCNPKPFGLTNPPIANRQPTTKLPLRVTVPALIFTAFVTSAHRVCNSTTRNDNVFLLIIYGGNAVGFSVLVASPAPSIALPSSSLILNIMAPTVSHLARLPSPPAPLLLVPGPKLTPFSPNAQANIEFVEFLGHENDKDSQVWKVKINGAGPFALKMVRNDIA